MNNTGSGISVAVELAGGSKQLAQMLGVTRQAVEVWIKRGGPPPERCAQIVIALQGQISRQALRPDIFHDMPPREQLPA